jgi:hypothetical protein
VAGLFFVGFHVVFFDTIIMVGSDLPMLVQ